MPESKTWLFYVLLAGLSWGTYVPLIFYGGSELGGKPASRILAILCVGVAYFVIAVVFPLYLFLSGQEQWPEWNTIGLVFSGLAGVAGAVGALCVVFASKAAVDAARSAGLDPSSYRLYIAPLIFGCAPVINTLVSVVWHPQKGEPFHFGLEHLPGWKLWAGIVLVGAGAFLVLLGKEESEAKPAAPPPTAAAAPPANSALPS
jgi:drug/metabolite transporter (DMT)-like permease